MFLFFFCPSFKCIENDKWMSSRNSSNTHSLHFWCLFAILFQISFYVLNLNYIILLHCWLRSVFDKKELLSRKQLIIRIYNIYWLKLIVNTAIFSLFTQVFIMLRNKSSYINNFSWSQSQYSLGMESQSKI